MADSTTCNKKKNKDQLIGHPIFYCFRLFLFEFVLLRFVESAPFRFIFFPFFLSFFLLDENFAGSHDETFHLLRLSRKLSFSLESLQESSAYLIVK